MTNDPIIEEIHAVRREFARKFGNDISAIGKELRRLEEAERASGRRFVSFPPKRIGEPDVTADPPDSAQ